MSDERKARAKEVRSRLFGRPPAELGIAGDEPRLPIEDELAALNQAYAFGDIYAREGLPLRTRSLLTIGILSALYRGDQLRVHIEGALNSGLTPEEILETIYHAGVYAGVPTANSGRAIAHDVFKKKGLIK